VRLTPFVIRIAAPADIADRIDGFGSLLSQH